MQRTLQFGHLIAQGNHKNMFRTKHDGISSKVIANQGGVILYMGTPGGQIPRF